MNTAPHTGRSHPLVLAYLDDLDRALAGADPQERLDTLTAVNEHLTEALAGDTVTDDQVRTVLADLGPVERIAAVSTPVPDAGDARPSTRWSAPALLVGSLASLALVPVMVWLAPVVAIGCLIATVILLRRGAAPRALLRAAAIVSTVTLLTTVALAATLLATTTVVSNSEVQPAVSP